MSYKYNNSLKGYSRLITKEVNIGGLKLGAGNPVRIQSMTNTNTADTNATGGQIIRMYDSGCELVRITAPSVKDALNLKEIKNYVRTRGCYVPLVADIHFLAEAAETAARIVEKVRINPGNYAEKLKTKAFDYTDKEYETELEMVSAKLFPLINICREYGTAIRIGVNHGSLSQRIMSRYGDTPEGMVESALEFARIFRNEGFENLVFSMKSSNVRVMVYAYRMLVNKALAEGLNYPVHLGVTEAGDGYEGRIKSAVGIGALLEDGIGDTIRISLTEPPEIEAPAAVSLLKKYYKIPEISDSSPEEDYLYNPFEYKKWEVSNSFNNSKPAVIADLTGTEISSSILKELNFVEKGNSVYPGKLSPDFIFSDDYCTLLNGINQIIPFSKYVQNIQNNVFPYFAANEYRTGIIKNEQLIFVEAEINNIEALGKSQNIFPVMVVDKNSLAEKRAIIFDLIRQNKKYPVILCGDSVQGTEEEQIMQIAAENGILFIDGLADGLLIKNTNNKNIALNNETAFNILQAARVRISKTEYIACPSCGRTQFDLVDVLKKVREKTSHLTGLKIGVMGCIVNGPGEMADADYGYVGAGNGKVTLYRGKEVIVRGVDSNVAVDQLIDIIKTDGRWVEP